MNDSTAKQKIANEQEKPVFRFFLSSGQEIESLEGLVVPVTEKTETVYRMLAGTD